MGEGCGPGPGSGPHRASSDLGTFSPSVWPEDLPRGRPEARSQRRPRMSGPLLFLPPRTTGEVTTQGVEPQPNGWHQVRRAPHTRRRDPLRPRRAPSSNERRTFAVVAHHVTRWTATSLRRKPRTSSAGRARRPRSQHLRPNIPGDFFTSLLRTPRTSSAGRARRPRSQHLRPKARGGTYVFSTLCVLVGVP
jgi:hypothetical protein